MSAKPIIAGRLYRVRTASHEFVVVASSACAAIVVVLDLI